MRKVSAVVPAAGLSSRFGGPNKMLAPWKDGTMVGTVVGVLSEIGLPVIVVTGRDSELVARAVDPAPIVHNPNFADGLGGSIAAGVAEAPEGDGILIVLGDMPSLRPEVVSTLIARFQSAPNDAILAPVYADEPDRVGHPVLFSPQHRDALLALTGDTGARAIVQTNKRAVIRIQFSGGLEDFDTPQIFEGSERCLGT